MCLKERVRQTAVPRPFSYITSIANADYADKRDIKSVGKPMSRTCEERSGRHTKYEAHRANTNHAAITEARRATFGVVCVFGFELFAHAFEVADGFTSTRPLVRIRQLQV